MLTLQVMNPASVPLGRLAITPGANQALIEAGLTPLPFLKRHCSGDWGNVCDEDKALNDAALKAGDRIHSAYSLDPNQPDKSYGDNCLWIITEADRSVTTLLLPDEY